MENPKAKVLYIESDNANRTLFEQSGGVEYLLEYDYTIAGSVQEAVEALEKEAVDAVVLNYSRKDTAALDQFEKVNKAPVIMVMTTDDQAVAIRATKARADSYLIKDPKGNYLKTLPLFLECAIKQRKEGQEPKGVDKYLRNLEKLAEERIIEMQKEVDTFRYAEEQLQIFYRLAEECSHGIGIATAHGTITYLNTALAEILGEGKPEDAIGKSLFDYYPESIQQRLKNEILPSVLEKGHWAGELGLLRVNGDFIPDIDNFIFIIRDKDGIPRYFTNVVIDTTKQKLMEEEKQQLQAQLIQARQMETVGRLAGEIAYPFNEIVSSIIGYAKLALAGLPKDDPLRDRLENIYHLGEQAAGLIRQLLPSSRTQGSNSGALKPEVH